MLNIIPIKYHCSIDPCETNALSRFYPIRCTMHIAHTPLHKLQTRTLLFCCKSVLFNETKKNGKEISTTDPLKKWKGFIKHFNLKLSRLLHWLHGVYCIQTNGIGSVKQKKRQPHQWIVLGKNAISKSAPALNWRHC